MNASEVPGFVAGKVIAETRRVFRKLNRKITRYSSPRIHDRQLRTRQAKFEKTTRSDHFRDGEDTFVLYRIIGNGLVPRHSPDQVLSNLKFQLEHETELQSCQKIWLVNRIFDASTRDAVVDLLSERGAEFFEIPFDFDVYRQIDTSMEEKRIDAFLEQISRHDLDQIERAELAKLRLKRLYVMNNNGARNVALNHGRSKAKWVLPWDGNCFITPPAWDRIYNDVCTASHMPYHLVNMARVDKNEEATSHTTPPIARDEPQIIFHRDSCDLFDEEIPYGRRPKVEFLDRIGLWGPWRQWDDDPWDITGSHVSPYRFLYSVSSGWVYRLSAGSSSGENRKKSDRHRHRTRNEAIRRTINHLDQLASKSN